MTRDGDLGARVRDSTAHTRRGCGRSVNGAVGRYYLGMNSPDAIGPCWGTKSILTIDAAPCYDKHVHFV